MQIFVSWSGSKSLYLARLFHSWLPNVIQKVRPFLSEEDIKKGARWPSELSERLEDCNFGIVCATPESIRAPWVLYEAGAISKLIDESALVSVLFGVEPADLLHHPLGGFQVARIEKGEILKVLKAINERLGDASLTTAHLEVAFGKWWDDFNREVAAWRDPVAEIVVGHTRDQSTPDATDRIHSQLGDLIQLSQELSRTLATPERLLPVGYLRSVLAGQVRHGGRYREPLSRIAMRVEDLRFHLRDVRASDDAQWRHFEKMLFSLERDVERLADALEMPIKLHGRGKRFFASRGIPSKPAQLDKPKSSSANSVPAPPDPGAGANGIHEDSRNGIIATDTASA